MIAPSKSPEIVVAVKLDERAPALIRAGVSLCRKKQLPLRLVHIVNRVYPTGIYPGGPEADFDVHPLPEFYGMVDIVGGPIDVYRSSLHLSRVGGDENAVVAGQAQRYIDSELEIARRELFELAEESCPEDLHVVVEAILGDFPDALLAHANHLEAALIITGASLQNPGFLKLKLRPVHKLLAKTTVPVLVVSDRRESLDFNRSPLRILIADDLTEDTLQALNVTEDLVEATGIPVSILHMHVDPLPTAGFALSPDYKLVVWPGISVEDRLINDQHELLKERLHKRGKLLKAKVEAYGGHYRIELWHGSVAEEIQRAVQVLNADISIFGQHHFMHRRPMSFGQMSFNSMLAVESAVLIAP